jgi:hypothetical protein
MAARCLKKTPDQKRIARRLGTKPKEKERHPRCVCSVREAERVRTKSLVSCKTELKAAVPADELLGWCWCVHSCRRSSFFFYFLKKKNHVVEVRLNDFASGSLSISVPRLLQSVHTLNTKHLESSTIQTKTSSLR